MNVLVCFAIQTTAHTGFSGMGMVEWNTGMVDYWNTGTVEYWNDD